jgi:hypothetical protein
VDDSDVAGYTGPVEEDHHTYRYMPHCGTDLHSLHSHWDSEKDRANKWEVNDVIRVNIAGVCHRPYRRSQQHDLMIKDALQY